MTDTLLELAEAMAQALEDFPSDGKTPNNEVTMALIAAGFIECRQITKPCRECGTERPDYGYCKITVGGKLFLAMARARHTHTHSGTN